MTYEEIERALKKLGRASTIQSLRAAVGEEGLALHQGIMQLKEDEGVEKAREFYAEDITKFLDGEMELDPEALIGMRDRYAKAWAFAEIIGRSQDEDEDEDEWTEASVDVMVTKLCLANTELSVKMADMVDQFMKARATVDLTDTVRAIMASLDSVKAPSMTELGNRDLNVLERVEAVLVEWKELRAQVRGDACGNCHSAEAAATDMAEIATFAVEINHNGDSHHNEGHWTKCAVHPCSRLVAYLNQVGLQRLLEPVRE